MAKSDHRAHRSRQLYQKVNGMRKGYKGHEKFIRNKDGELITTKMEVTEYFEHLLNGEDPEEIFDCIQELPNNS
ncbi:ribosome biogenesis protein TSR3 isoform X1, partial [Aphis craccivora]